MPNNLNNLNLYRAGARQTPMFNMNNSINSIAGSLSDIGKRNELAARQKVVDDRADRTRQDMLTQQGIVNTRAEQQRTDLLARQALVDAKPQKERERIAELMQEPVTITPQLQARQEAWGNDISTKLDAAVKANGGKLPAEFNDGRFGDALMGNSTFTNDMNVREGNRLRVLQAHAVNSGDLPLSNALTAPITNAEAERKAKEATFAAKGAAAMKTLDDRYSVQQKAILGGQRKSKWIKNGSSSKALSFGVNGTNNRTKLIDKYRKEIVNREYGDDWGGDKLPNLIRDLSGDTGIELGDGVTAKNLKPQQIDFLLASSKEGTDSWIGKAKEINKSSLAAAYKDVKDQDWFKTGSGIAKQYAKLYSGNKESTIAALDQLSTEKANEATTLSNKYNNLDTYTRQNALDSIGYTAAPAAAVPSKEDKKPGGDKKPKEPKELEFTKEQLAEFKKSLWDDVASNSAEQQTTSDIVDSYINGVPSVSSAHTAAPSVVNKIPDGKQNNWSLKHMLANPDTPNPYAQGDILKDISAKAKALREAKYGFTDEEGAKYNQEQYNKAIRTASGDFAYYTDAYGDRVTVNKPQGLQDQSFSVVPSGIMTAALGTKVSAALLTKAGNLTKSGTKVLKKLVSSGMDKARAKRMIKNHMLLPRKPQVITTESRNTGFSTNYPNRVDVQLQPANSISLSQSPY